MQDKKSKFINWLKLKLKIQFKDPHIDYFRNGQIWWVSLGQNIGSEENGKNINFERPVLVLKRINRQTFWALPTSTQTQKGKYRYVFERDGKQYSVKLSQIRLISCKRLIRLVGDIKKDDFKNIKNKLKKLI